MGWQDRSYYRDGPRSQGNPLMWLLTGSVPLFTAFGIRVRAHASLIITMIIVLLLGWGFGPMTWQERLAASIMLFTIVLLHEFGHCFAARWMGGTAEDILMHPLGGLAMARPPHRPWSTFVTVACGPLVNVLICIATGLVLWFKFSVIPWNPFGAYFWAAIEKDRSLIESYNTWGLWVRWCFSTSWTIFLFNLLPIFPLDGGQIVQTALWKRVGYYKSMIFACVTGMVGAVIVGMYGLAWGGMTFVVLAIMGFVACYQMRQQLLAAGPWGFQEEDAVDYSASIYGGTTTRKSTRANERLARQTQRRQAEDRALQAKVDHILEKVSQHGMMSLTWWEKRTLRKATEKQKAKDDALRGSSRRH